MLDADAVYLQQARKARVAIKLPEWQWAHEPYACPPAIAIGPRGEALVTSNVLPVLWKIDPQTRAVTVHRPGARRRYRQGRRLLGAGVLGA